MQQARMSDELDQADADYTAKKASYDNLPTFKRDMKEKYDQVSWLLELKSKLCRMDSLFLSV